MRYCEIIPEDLNRRDFLRGLIGAAGLGATGTSPLKPEKTQPSQPIDTKQTQQTSDTPKYSPEVLKKYIIDYAKEILPPNQVVPFIAQIAHETHNFRSLEENLNYSSQVLLKKYPKLFTKQQIEYIENHPSKAQIIANTIYANRMKNGDYKSGDGYRYRGRGYIQLTGLENYERMSKLIGVDLVNNPDLAARPDYAAKIAVKYWQTRVANKANTSNIAQVTKKISGSARQGLASRKEKLKQYNKELDKK